MHNVIKNSVGTEVIVANTIKKSDGSSFTIFTDNVDTTTPVGKVFFAEDVREFLA